MNERSLIWPVGDAELASQYKRQAAEMVETENNFKSEWVRGHRWIVVPVESQDHFDEPDAILLAAALAACRAEECLAVLTEAVDISPSVYSLSATVEGLLAFNETCGMWAYCVFPPDRTFCVLCSKEDYYLVAGPRQIVELGVGGNIDLARLRFEASAKGWRLDKMRQLQLRVAARYRELEAEVNR